MSFCARPVWTVSARFPSVSNYWLKCLFPLCERATTVMKGVREEIRKREKEVRVVVVACQTRPVWLSCWLLLGTLASLTTAHMQTLILETSPSLYFPHQWWKRCMNQNVLLLRHGRVLSWSGFARWFNVHWRQGFFFSIFMSLCNRSPITNKTQIDQEIMYSHGDTLICLSLRSSHCRTSGFDCASGIFGYLP